MTISAIIDQLLLHIYRVTLSQLILYGVFTAMIFYALQKRCIRMGWLRPMLGTILGCWIAAVLWITVFGRNSTDRYEVHWIPLRAYLAVFLGEDPDLLRSCMMNVVLFFPGGSLWAALLPQNRSPKRGIWSVVLLFGLFSLCIELSQYFFRLGNMEMDDILHNTLGAAAGFSAFHIDWEGAGARRTHRENPSSS